jgi:hypothetical protein
MGMGLRIILTVGGIVGIGPIIISMAMGAIAIKMAPPISGIGNKIKNTGLVTLQAKMGRLLKVSGRLARKLGLSKKVRKLSVR